MSIFKDLTVKHLAALFQKSKDEKLKSTLKEILLTISSHEGASINVDLSSDNGDSNKHIFQLISSLRKNDSETKSLLAEILAKREELFAKFFSEINSKNIDDFLATLKRMNEIENSENRKWFKGSNEKCSKCIIDFSFAGFSNNEVDKICISGKYEEVRNWLGNGEKFDNRPVFTHVTFVYQTSLIENE